jgi:hypothetical protein
MEARGWISMKFLLIGMLIPLNKEAFTVSLKAESSKNSSINALLESSDSELMTELF